MRALADAGGVLMLTFVSSFISAECANWDADLRQKAVSRGMGTGNLDVMLFRAIDYLEYAREMMGVESTGLAGDYDGMSEVPVGLEDVSCYPVLFAVLLERGWSLTDCAKLAGRNIPRVTHEAESVAEPLAR